MALPKEPRQKMINIMYLVLTALLALNVSSEILNAFKTVNNSLVKTTATVNKSTGDVYQSLVDKKSDPATAAKAAYWEPKAKAAMDKAATANAFIQGLKDEILRAAGGDPNDPNKKFKEDNLDIATRLLIKQGKGKQLLQVLTDFRNNMLGLDDSLKSQIEQRLQIDLEKPKSQAGDKKNWEETYFHMVPTVAALTILSKFQNDIKTSENKVVTLFHEQVGKVEIRFDAFEPIIGQNSKYLMPGQDLEITAGLGAFSTTNRPSITINGSHVETDEKGMAIQKMQAGGVGSHSVKVVVNYKDQDGIDRSKEAVVDYVVGSANASIALDKMNVLYVGIDNPITIAASGGGDDKVQASITGGGGSLTRLGGGKYIARVSSLSPARITVMVDGKLAGASDFRVQLIPEANAFVGGKPSGENITASAFKAQGGVGAGIKNFPFELEYNVLSFTFTCDTDDDLVSIPNQGAAFSPAVRAAMNQHLKSDRTVTIDDIRVKGPDGRTTKAPSLVYYIK